MIVIDGDHMGGSLPREIEKLERLLADLKRLLSGRFPAIADIANAPRIDGYSIVGAASPCLAGVVTGHPHLGDGHLIVSSELWVISPEQEWARTLSRTYRLGRPRAEKDIGRHP
ncbi:MAG: hypothetical protein HY985_02960 [Magnetospirillum sp.]|nr:hypothetical protein [Magnetospirillum sp.]